ncbi:MAG: hypothetical protein SVM86_07765 [Candidatus Cloacimonadota bacterium]|nr:hypothetical protein [Candidatus Cloacimonadota bacterium]
MKKIAFLLVIISLSLLGCKTTKLTSTLKTAKIIIDANITEWEGKMTTLSRKKVSIGAQHDDRYLYLCLQLNNQKIIPSIMRKGFELWFDGAGRKNETVGIRFIAMDKPKSKPNFAAGNEKADKPEFPESFTKIEILNNSDTSEKLNKEDLIGLDYAINNTIRFPILEMKIPIQANAVYSTFVDAVPNREIALKVSSVSDGEEPEKDFGHRAPPSGQGGIGKQSGKFTDGG